MEYFWLILNLYVCIALVVCKHVDHIQMCVRSLIFFLRQRPSGSERYFVICLFVDWFWHLGATDWMNNGEQERFTYLRSILSVCSNFPYAFSLSLSPSLWPFVYFWLDAGNLFKLCMWLFAVCKCWNYLFISIVLFFCKQNTTNSKRNRERESEKCADEIVLNWGRQCDQVA